MWDWLIQNGFFTPLNNVESLMAPTGSSCDPGTLVWNQLKGSWNLSLQTLGWGRYLAEREGRTPILWQAATTNALVHKGYALLAAGGVSPTPASAPSIGSPVPWLMTRECETADEGKVSQIIWRLQASGSSVYGQYGAADLDQLILNQNGCRRFALHSDTSGFYFCDYPRPAGLV